MRDDGAGETAPRRPLRVLFVEDSEEDILLTRRELERSGYDVEAKRVDSAEALRSALAEPAWDVVVSDHRMPGFDCLGALAVCRQSGLDLPFIVVSGAIGEETAVAAMRAGAHDYVPKDRLTRLGVVVQREIEAAQERQARRCIEEALARSEHLYRSLAEQARHYIYVLDADARVRYVNSVGASLFGKTPAEVAGRSIEDLFPPDAAARQRGSIRRVLESGEALDTLVRTPFPGRELWLDVSLVPLRDEAGRPSGVLGVSRDVTRQRVMEAALREAEERYRLYFDQAADAILLVDSDDSIVEFNRTACERLGYTREEFSRLGMPALDAVNAGEPRVHHFDRIRREGTGVFETRQRRKNGEEIDVLVNARLLTHRGRRLLHAVCTDITRRRRAEHDLRAVLEQLQNVDQVRSEFVSNVSHELKTPVACMIYAARNLLNGVAGPLPDRVAHYVRIVESEALRLSNTVNDILDMRKAEAGELRLSKIRVPIARLVGRRTDALSVQASEKRMEVAVALDRQTGFVDCDPEKIERVVHNVIGNAIKFTPPGGRLDVAVSRDPERWSQVLISVQDTGIGIPPEALPRIAERYFRAGNHPEGSGLGLAISKELLRLHGGTLEVQSPPSGRSHGTVVYVRLPASDPLHVLVLADRVETQIRLRNELIDYGYSVTVGDVESVDRWKTGLRPDCIVIDAEAGTRAAIRLRSIDALRECPVVAAASSPLDETARKMLAELEVQVVGESGHAHALVDGIEEVFMRRILFQRLRGRPDTVVKPASPPAPPVNRTEDMPIAPGAAGN